MPANLPPDYYKLVHQLADTRDALEKAAIIEEMLSVIPKHKGTDHLRGDLRRKLARFKQKAAEKKGGSRHDLFLVEKTGAGQVALLGLPNAGKSALVEAVSNAQTNVADYPFATHAPVPGMMMYENIQIQLVDLPPMAGEETDFRVLDAARRADAVMLVVDITDDPAAAIREILAVTEARHLYLSHGPPDEPPRGAVWKRALLVFTKAESAEAREEARALSRTYAGRLPSLCISAILDEGLGQLARGTFELLQIIRIYSRKPGQKVDMANPFILEAGSTIERFARAVHNEVAQSFKSARVWGSARYPGQHVERTHVLADGDVVEVLTR